MFTCTSDSRMGKITDIWEAVEDQRPASVPKFQWKRSFSGVKAALKHVGFELIMTPNTFDDIPIPLNRENSKRYDHRKVVVTRVGRTSEPTRIADLMTGHSGVLTNDESRIINQSKGVTMSAQRPKGVSTTHNAESRAVDELDVLLGLSGFLRRQHLYEFRLADIAYCLSTSTDLAHEVWVGDQVKHSIANDSGQCNFAYADAMMTVAGMISYLNAGVSLTCIGKTTDDKVDVVWFFHGQCDITMLSQFDSKQTFQPRLHLKVTSFNKFTEAYNAKRHRYDIGHSADECKRLLERKVSAVHDGVKRSLTYLNENDSQILGENHRLEHRAFVLTRAACARIGVDIARATEDAYGPVDFRLCKIVRNQDKIFGGQVCMRSHGGLPYNPDDIDILQLTNLDSQRVYALPMRLVKDDKIVSTFSETALMRQNLTCSAAWKEANKNYLYDLKNEAGIRAYVEACTAASQVPILTDCAWYSNMLAANAQKFGSKKQLKERKAAAKTAASESLATTI